MGLSFTPGTPQQSVSTGFPIPGGRVADSWARGDPYEQYIGRWSRRVAPAFLSLLNARPGRLWLDVGCGTGALCAAILDHCAPSWLAGMEPSAGFRETAQAHLAGRAVIEEGDATALPLTDSAVDVVVSGLVLNFVPDPCAALVEWTRVTRSGGTIAAYVWDYAGEMELIRYFWDAAVELDRSAAGLDEGVRFPVCQPEPLAELFIDAGLTQPQMAAIDIATPFASFDDYWTPFLGGQGPAPAYAMSLRESARSRLRDRLRERLPVQADGSINLIARAWAIRAINDK